MLSSNAMSLTLGAKMFIYKARTGDIILNLGANFSKWAQGKIPVNDSDDAKTWSCRQWYLCTEPGNQRISCFLNRLNWQLCVSWQSVHCLGPIRYILSIGIANLVLHGCVEGIWRSLGLHFEDFFTCLNTKICTDCGPVLDEPQKLSLMRTRASHHAVICSFTDIKTCLPMFFLLKAWKPVIELVKDFVNLITIPNLRKKMIKATQIGSMSGDFGSWYA